MWHYKWFKSNSIRADTAYSISLYTLPIPQRRQSLLRDVLE